MQVRALEEGDLDGLCALALEIYDEAPYATTFSARPERAELERMVERKLDGMRSGTTADVVAGDGERIIADCEIVKAAEGRGMIGIVVAKDHRRKGLGKELVERCVEEARRIGIREVYAEIDGKNSAASGFFASCGFTGQAAGKEKLVMLKTL